MRVYDTSDDKITQYQAFFWVGDAIGAYCPWHSQDASKPN